MAYEVAKVSEHPELEGMVFKLKRLYRDANKWGKEHSKKRDEYLKKYQDNCQVEWRKIEDFIMEKGLVRDGFSKERDGLSLKEDYSLLVCQTDEETRKEHLADMLMKSMPEEVRDALLRPKI